MSIFVIRHGETESNATRIVQTPDVPLNARGLEQAARLGDRLASEGIALILASDHARAEMTAREVAARTGAPIELVPDLRERNFGDLRGTPYAEIGADIFAEDFAPPAGETWAVFHERVATAWAAVVARRAALAGPLAVITHGLVCRSLALRQLALPAGLGHDVRGFRNTSLTVVDPRPPHAASIVNCCAHLEDEIAARGIAGI